MSFLNCLNIRMGRAGQFYCQNPPLPDRFTLSHASVTRRRPPEVGSTAFAAQPPDLPPAALIAMGFAAFRPLARCRRPLDPVLVHRLAPLLHASFRPRLATEALALRYHFSSIRM